MSATVVDRAFEDAWRSVSHIEGWLTRKQALRLFTAARRIAPGAAIVEIGSHRGKSTIVLAKAKRANVTLIAVDPFADDRWGGGSESLEVFRRNLQSNGVGADVTLHRGTSATAASELSGARVGLLFVDGAHDRRSVLTDIDSWQPHLHRESLVFFHDAFSAPGVTAAILRRLLLSRRLEYIGSEQSLAMFRKTEASVASTAVSRLRLLGRLGYFARNVAVKVALHRRWYRLTPVLGHRARDYPY